MRLHGSTGSSPRIQSRGWVSKRNHTLDVAIMMEEQRWAADLMTDEEASGRTYDVVGYDDLYEVRRREALDRDDHECCECGSGEDLEVHHVVSIREFCDPEAAHSLSNLRTLCSRCHIDVHT